MSSARLGAGFPPSDAAPQVSGSLEQPALVAQEQVKPDDQAEGAAAVTASRVARKMDKPLLSNLVRASLTWHQLQLTAVDCSPFGRCGHGAALSQGPGRQAVLHVVGGHCKSAKLHKETSSCHISSNLKQGTWRAVQGTTPFPSLSFFSTAVVGSHIVVFGGLLDGEKSNQTFMFNTSNGRWSEPSLIEGSDLPQPRHRHGGCSVGRGMVIHGGVGADSQEEDAEVILACTYQLEIKGGRLQWSLLRPMDERDPQLGTASTVFPAPRKYGHAVCAASDKLWSFGGVQVEDSSPRVVDLSYRVEASPKVEQRDRADKPTATMHFMCFETPGVTDKKLKNLWFPVENEGARGAVPRPRTGHTLTAVADKYLMVAFGFDEYGAPFNDLSLFHLGSLMWTRPTTEGSVPPGRAWHSAVPLYGGNKILIFGGFGKKAESIMNSDLWVGSVKEEDDGLPDKSAAMEIMANVSERLFGTLDKLQEVNTNEVVDMVNVIQALRQEIVVARAGIGSQKGMADKLLSRVRVAEQRSAAADKSLAHIKDTYQGRLIQAEEKYRSTELEVKRLGTKLARALGSTFVAAGAVTLVPSGDVEVQESEFSDEVDNLLLLGGSLERLDGEWSGTPVSLECFPLCQSREYQDDRSPRAGKPSTPAALRRMTCRSGEDSVGVSPSKGGIRRGMMAQAQDEMRRAAAEEKKWIEATLSELRIVSRLRHTQLMDYYGAAQLGDCIAIIGDPFTACLADVVEELEDEEIPVVAKDIVNGLDYLHARGVAHKHVCPSNVFVREGRSGLEAKLGGFFTARVSCRVAEKPFVPSEYVPKANNSLTAAFYDEGADPRKGDIFAFGVLLCHVYTREEPRVDTRVSTVDRIGKKAVQMLVMKCLDSDPKHRPTATMLQVALEVIGSGSEPSFEPLQTDPSNLTPPVETLSLDE